MNIYKIVPAPLWADATKSGSFRGSPVDVADGFIHFSTAAQIHETAARHFTGIADLLLVAFPASAFGDALKWERSRGGALFPHLYESLPVNLAVWEKPMPLDASGKPIVPPL
ncbi:MAG: DUF952 domain-containing protein [Cyanobacteria bacterium]|nr:DUF952 domain-containing protein [Cyanobacteriota bacterium]